MRSPARRTPTRSAWSRPSGARSGSAWPPTRANGSLARAGADSPWRTRKISVAPGGGENRCWRYSISCSGVLMPSTLAKLLVDETPAPGLARLETAHDRVPCLVGALGRVAPRRRVAAGDLPALQAHPQVHPGRAFGQAGRATVLRARLQIGPFVLEVLARPGRRRRGTQLAVGHRYLLLVPVEHRLLDVEPLQHPAQHLVVRGAAGARLQELVAFHLQELDAQATVGVTGRLRQCTLPSELFPRGIRAVFQPVAEALDDLGRVFGMAASPASGQGLFGLGLPHGGF